MNDETREAFFPPKPRAQITQEVLELLDRGGGLQAVTHARDILIAAGCEVEPHPLELARVMELRAQARRLLDEASLLEDSL